MLVIGVDPGTGVSSPTGVAIFDPTRRKVLYTERLFPDSPGDDLAHKLAAIRDRFAFIVRFEVWRAGLGDEVLMAIESFVMRGKGGETLARCTGALMSCCDENVEVTLVNNLKMKKIVWGTGRASKAEVALGVNKWFGKDVTAGLSDDETDALAIGIAGYITRAGGK